MNVLFLINYAGDGGTEAYVDSLISGLPGVCSTLCYNVEGRLSRRLQAQKFPTLHLQMRHAFDCRAAKTLAAYCIAHKIDLIHAQYPRENRIALLSRRFGCPARVIYTAHLSVRQPFWWRALNRRSPDAAVIALTEAQRAGLIANGFSPEQITVIPNGVPRIARAAPPEDGIFRMVTASRLSAEKGLLFLCDSIAALRKKTTQPFCVDILGEGGQRRALARKIKKCGLEGIVRLRGFQENVPQWLTRANLYVCPSRSEAMSLSLLEAMSAGLPILATDACGVPDACALTVPYGNVSAFSGALLRLMCDRALRERLSAAAPQYDITETCRKTAELYQRSLSNGTEETKI